MTRQEAIKELELHFMFSESDIKSAYRRLARKYHPDLAGAECSKKFTRINDAYELLLQGGSYVPCKLTHDTIFDIHRREL